MKKLVLLLFASILLFSCKDDEPTPEPLTVAEIQQDIHNTFDGFVTCMQGYEDGDFSTAMKNFLSISNGEGNEDYAELLADELAVFDFDYENFSMNDHSGVYNWDANSEMWTYMSNTSNTLEFNFPETSSGTTNNMIVTINQYEIQSFVIGGNTEYRPLRFLGSIQKNNSEIFNIDLDNVTYRTVSGEDEVVPVSLSLEIRTSPMTHMFTLTETSTNVVDFDYSSHSNSSCNTTFSIDASTVTTDATLVEEFSDLNNVSGTIGHDNFQIRFNAENIHSTDVEEATVDEINDLITAKVYLGNEEVGELEYSEENDDVVIYIVYNDGTRENVENYVNEDLADELEAIFSDYTN